MTGDPERGLATELERRGLGPLARLLVNAHRPLAPLLADAGAALGPLVGAVGGSGAADLQRLMADPAALDRLAAALEALEERHAESG